MIIKLPLRQSWSFSLFYGTSCVIGETEWRTDSGGVCNLAQLYHPALKLQSFHWFYKAFSHSFRHWIFSPCFFNIHLHKYLLGEEKLFWAVILQLDLPGKYHPVASKDAWIHCSKSSCVMGAHFAMVNTLA